MHSPLVSVVICTNRNDNYLDLSVNSIISQSYDNIEIILVINNVSDDTYDSIINKFKSIKNITLIRTKIHGIMASRNIGIHYCRGKYMAVMDSDDISEERRLEKQVNFLESNPTIDVCGSSYYIIDENNNIINKVHVPTNNISKKLWYKNPICHPSCLIKVSTLISSGGYSGYSAEDYGLWLRLLSKNAKFSNIDDFLFKYRVPITSKERYSKLAYIHVATSQLKMFLLTWNVKWFFGFFLTLFKMSYKAKQA
ncbi:glycosyltransferase [Morganella morganii]|nr:glycosyltransferase [Morganella morganii]